LLYYQTTTNNESKPMATVSNTLQIEGIQETMKALKAIEPAYAKQIRKDIKKAGAPVLTAARSLIPTSPPLSGMARGNLIKGRDGTKWDNATVKKGFIINVNKAGQRTRTVTFKSGETVDFAARPYNLLKLTQRDSAGAIWDHAGAKIKGRFVTNLEMKGSVNPRAAEPGVEAARPAVEKEVVAIVKEVMKKTNNKLRKRRGD
jgi:hypothetical protein